MYDVVIIGSGPAGLSAAVYARRAKLKVLVIEKAGYSGGQIVNASDVDNYLGLQGIDGFEMAMKFRDHAEHFEAKFLDDEVLKVSEKIDEKSDVIFELEMKTGTNILTRSVIVATGASHNKLDIVGEAEYTGKGVSYCATCDGGFYKDKTVAVVGGGDVALEDALYLSNIAEKVYLIHRRDTLRGAKSLQDKVFLTDNIQFISDSVVSSIDGDNGLVSSILVKNLKTEEETHMNVSGIFIAVGMKPASSLIEGLVKTDDNGYIVAGEEGITSKNGIFVAGDVRTKALRQVITAVSDGANAVASVEKYLR